jgi:PKD repeat protein
LIITSIQSSGTNVIIRFTSSAGAFYRVEYTDGLVLPVWKTAVDLVPGTGDVVTSIHIGGLSQSARFYRIHLLNLAELSPSADFNADITFGLAPLLVNFVDTSAGNITNRFWDFGDGATTNTTLATVSHTYTSSGSNTVGLTVTGPLGSSTTIRTNLIVLPRQVIISGIQLSGANVTISFSSESGRSYRIEYTDDLSLPWNIAVDSVPGTGGIVSAIQVGGGSAASRFYRIRQF